MTTQLGRRAPLPPGVFSPADFEQAWRDGRREFEGITLGCARPHVTISKYPAGWRVVLVWPEVEDRDPFDLAGRPYSKQITANAVGRRHAETIGLDFHEVP